MIEFKLPELGENIDQGDLVRLMVAPGTSVSAGQAVMELETDKAVVEVPSSVSGTVQEIRVKEGQKIKVGQVIFTVENGAGGKAAESKQAPTPTPIPSPAKPEREPSTDLTSSQSSAASAPAPSRAPAASAAEFRLPELGENISQGDLVRLMIAPGTKWPKASRSWNWRPTKPLSRCLHP